MKPREQVQIEQELGQWNNTISFPDHSLKLKLEKSDNDIELMLPNPEKELILLARPNGFQLTSHFNKIRKNFSIHSDSIISVQLLPSFTCVNHPTISFKYILATVIIFGAIGSLPAERPNLLLWIFLGLTFGLTVSLVFNRTYRQNLLMTISENGERSFLLFTIDKRQKQSCITFFNNFIKDKFSA